MLIEPRDPSAGIRHPVVLHVHLDDPGGGPAHVRMLTSGLEREISAPRLALPPGHLGLAPAHWGAVARTIRSAVAEHGASLVHAHGVRAAAWARLAAPRSTPVICTIHGLHSIRRGGGRFVEAFNRRTLRSMAAVLLLSEADRASIIEYRLAPPELLHGIRPLYHRPRLYDSSEARALLRLPPDAVLVLWIGRLSDEKAPLTVVETMELVPEAHGVVVGSGPLEGRLQDMTARSSAKDRIHLMGWLDDPDPAYSAADAYLSTSLWESMPMTALEAASAGLPLILTDRPGNREVAKHVPDATLASSPLEQAEAVRTIALRTAGERSAHRQELIARMAEGDGDPDGAINDVIDVYRQVGAFR